MVDFGYDISDFYNIARIFGTKEDFQSLKKKLHSLSEFEFKYLLTVKVGLYFMPIYTGI